VVTAILGGPVSDETRRLIRPRRRSAARPRNVVVESSTE
jgi:hypothetical protein